jgi:hypothetical protein
MSNEQDYPIDRADCFFFGLFVGALLVITALIVGFAIGRYAGLI